MHQTQDTYSLTHFRQKTQEHLDRIAGGAVETITQNGEAAIVVMSPARYDFLVHASERGHLWSEAIRRYEAGGSGVEAGEAIRQLAAAYGVEL
ncbi:MAG: type II toxin-antitoxin system Phd/YefM family antitoxin [Gemmatimonadota bacterium]|nr:type II toxin-antitoxin system Phd/YefM family antitoxin [Gemmatimonadota bacterium]MDE2865275.1 type II toxin-antitoxin system Phd/YefM family antitoxin [Gemmatimonadota bacterium]